MKKSVHEELCVVLDSRSKNIVHATVGPERVYTATLAIPNSVFLKSKAQEKHEVQN